MIDNLISKYSSNNNKNDDEQYPTSSKITTIVGSALEVLIHELLYQRCLYPRDAFTCTRYVGVSCHACRHPSVVDYVYQTLIVAVPALCSGVADELSLVFYDSAYSRPTQHGTRVDEKIWERFTFSFQVPTTTTTVATAMKQKQHNNTITKTMTNNPDFQSSISHKIQELEWSFRNVLLKLISMDGSPLGRRACHNQSSSNSINHCNFTPTTTFKLCLHTTTKSRPRVENDSILNSSYNNNDDEDEHYSDNSTKCPELYNALVKGEWFQPDLNTCNFTDTITTSKTNSRTQYQDDTDNQEQRYLAGNNNTSSDQQNYSSAVTTRPIKSVHVPSCGLKMQLIMEVDTNEYK